MSSVRLAVPRGLPLFTSFLGVLDLKLGVEIMSLFALLNKVAGVYGILAVFTGGTVAQVTLYLYSIGTIFVLLWGMKKVGEEDHQSVLVYAHLFLVDHLVNTAYMALFGTIWYLYIPHDGRRIANSEAQKQMVEEAGKLADSAARKAAAERIWKSERGFAAVVLVLGWLLKVYFIIALYSFALHLARGTYHSLPLTRSQHPRSSQRPTRNGYGHLRNTSIATDSTIDATLAETLWEDEDSDAMPLPVATSASSAGTPKGGTMTRSLSGQGKPGETKFKSILGRLSMDDAR